jgi:hypothetical protein
MKKIYFLILIIIIFFGVVKQANALITYDDKDLFMAETGSISATGVLPELGYIGVVGIEQTVGDVTFTAAVEGGLWIGHATGDWCPEMEGADIALDGWEHLDTALTTPAHAYGFDFYQRDRSPHPASLFQVAFFNETTFLDSFNFVAPIDEVYFVGFEYGSLFNKVEIREISGSALDEYYGQFYTDTAPPIPLPSTLLLLGFGLIGIAGLKRKKSN